MVEPQNSRKLNIHLKGRQAEGYFEPRQSVQQCDLDAAVAELLRRESHAYVTLWESLTKNEQRFEA